MLVIGKQYSFEAAHHLPDHDGKCRNPHGHSYRVEVEVKGQPVEEGPKSGMVLDFTDLDSHVRYLVSMLDHSDLNLFNDKAHFRLGGTQSNPLSMPPTCEHICLWFVSELLLKYPAYSASIKGEVQLNRVRVYETASSYAEWRVP